MPAYQLHLVEQREERQNLYQQRISEQIDDCTEIAKNNIRNHVKKFLIAQGLQDITEIEYPIRRLFEMGKTSVQRCKLFKCAGSD